MSKHDELIKAQGNMDGSLGLGVALGVAPPGMSLDNSQRIPARLQGVTKAKDAAVIPTEKIQTDPDQPREEFDPESLERLAESLKTRGQLQPIRVRWDEGRGVYVIITGERRWRAAVQAGLPTLTCIVQDGTAGPEDLLAMQLVENALREDLKPVEQARAFKKLLDAKGWSHSQLARELSIPVSAVTHALALLKLPETVQSRVESGELAARTAYELSKLPDSASQLELAEQAATGKLPVAQAADVVKARKAGRPTPASVAARREVKLDNGTKVTITGADAVTPEAQIAALQAAIKRIRAELKQAGPSQAA